MDRVDFVGGLHYKTVEISSLFLGWKVVEWW